MNKIRGANNMCWFLFRQLHVYRGGSGGPAGTVWARPLFEFLTFLLAINHYKTTK